MTLVVTSGTGHIGRELVLAAVRRGHAVAFSYRSPGDVAERLLGEAKALSAAADCRAYPLDQRSSGETEAFMDAVVEDFGRVDAVIINTATSHAAMAVDMSDEAWRAAIDINVTGSFFIAREALNHFLPQRGGRLVFVSSTACRGASGAASQAASSSAALGLSASIAKEYGRKGISSNALLLGPIEGAADETQLRATQNEFGRRYSPLGRLTTSSEVAEALLFLAYAAPRAMNGGVLALDGGLTWQR